MSARLTTAIKIGDAANAILQRVLRFDHDADVPIQDDHIGVEPMLLALSMELALKAWYVFDYDNKDHKLEHDLAKLYSELKPESQDRLDKEFIKSIAPMHRNGFAVDYGIKSVLEQHASAFIDWRYLHEATSLRFDQSAFIATLEMVIREFRKRYRTEKVEPHLSTPSN